jgi:hypothetical protein
MNFQDLLAKIKQIDESEMVPPTAPVMDPTDEDPEFGECGDMSPTSVMPRGDDQVLTGECGDMGSQMSAPKQSDSVTMNVSMNGSGAGGIKDLLDILRNIENSSGQDTDDVLVGIGAEEDFDNATTRPNPRMVPTPDSGDDLHREKEEYPKANGGGNPMRMHETLVSKLSARYNEIKGA